MQLKLLHYLILGDSLAEPAGDFEKQLKSSIFLLVSYEVSVYCWLLTHMTGECHVCFLLAVLAESRQYLFQLPFK